MPKRHPEARAVGRLQADFRVALTGTPVENHLAELWSLFRVISPGLLGTWPQFRERFAAPIERDQSAERHAALGQVLRPFILRRTKESVLPELPPLIELDRLVSLSATERELYESARLAAANAITGTLPCTRRSWTSPSACSRARGHRCSGATVGGGSGRAGAAQHDDREPRRGRRRG